MKYVRRVPSVRSEPVSRMSRLGCPSVSRVSRARAVQQIGDSEQNENSMTFA